MRNLQLFLKILYNNIIENKEVLSIISFLILVLGFIGFKFANVRYIHFILTLFIEISFNVLITIFIIKTIETINKIKLENKFELTKNIFIEILNSIINSFGYLENDQPYNNSTPDTNINTPNIKNKFPKFQIHENLPHFKIRAYINHLISEYNTELELLRNWVIPSFKRQAISKNFYQALNQLEFEICRIRQLQQFSNMNNINKKYDALEENSLNHLENTLRDFWKSLYEEYNKFYNNTSCKQEQNIKLINIGANRCIIFLGWSIVIVITFLSKSQWCYLLLVIYIILKLKLIDENFLKNLNSLKQAWNGNYNTSNINKYEQQRKQKEITSEIKQSTIKKSKSSSSKKIINEYELSESLVIEWFAHNLDMFFEANKKVVNEHKSRIFPDGILENETKISILEVKRGFENTNNRELLKRGLETLSRTKKFYEYSDKLINLYLAFVSDNNNNILPIKKYIYANSSEFRNIYIYFFKQKEKNIEFIEKIDI